ncbi:MAG TPA: hypothetical protein VGR07_22760 [Thermoanaerobaculia bacterium]|nr:hypothetical protein [Thermoanaerobaculia bacterium]
MPKLHIGLLAALLSCAPLAATPYLVKDLNRGPADPGGAALNGAVAAGEILYFSASDPAHGFELWRSDGTPAGTYRLTDVCPGRCDSDPREIHIFRGAPYWSADDGAAGHELWTTDGTPGHEHRVKDVCLGPCDGDPQGFAAAGDRLLFFATLGRRRQLWRTDGTAAGTARVATLCTAPLEGVDCLAFQGLQSIGSRALFELFGPTATDLWVSDGTAAGTFPLKSRVSGLPDPTSAPIPAGGFAFFWTADGLWRTDGTAAGTARVKALADLVPARPGVDRTVYRLAVSGGVLYTVLGTGDLVRSDGSPEGTYILRTFQAGYAVNDLTPLAGALLFEVDGTTGDPEASLWRTGGTVATTEKIATFPRFGAIEVIVSLGDRAVFRIVYRTASSETSEIWVTAGTASGTALVTALGPSDHNPFAVTAGRAFFGQPGADPQSNILWTTDATSAGTFPLRDFGAGPGSGAPLEQTAFGGRLLFSARTAPLSAPLFLSDGTAAGTVPLSRQALFATGFTQVGGEVFFAAGAGAHQIPVVAPVRDGLWKTDGTPAGTVRLADVFGFAFPKRLGGSLLFTAAVPSPVGSNDLELLRNDGAFGGSTLVKQINPYAVDGPHHACLGASSSPGPGVLVGGRLLFAADDGVHGRELWTSDGTARGTRLVADINPLRSPTPPEMCSDAPDGRTDTGLASNPDGFARLGDGAVALFAADDGAAGRELWRTDGTARGTKRVADLLPGPFGSAPHDLTRLGNLIYFFASPTGTGDALYRTDGTAKGTFLVSDLQLNGTPTWAKSLTVSGGKLFFAAYNELIGAELWTSTGKAGDINSTRILADLNFGPASSSPQFLTDIGGSGGALLFAADDGLHGLELWRTDGTGKGTLLLGDIHPGPAASSPGPFTVVGDRVFFGADDGVHGRELWAIPVDDAVNP